MASDEEDRLLEGRPPEDHPSGDLIVASAAYVAGYAAVVLGLGVPEALSVWRTTWSRIIPRRAPAGRP